MRRSAGHYLSIAYTSFAPWQYLRDFSGIVNEGDGVEDIVNAMLKLHGDRDNPRTLWHSARVAVAKRDA
jgi:hypothetical protein